jgi:phenylpropionate dioxygenase-like ring-hydroxylating dioxygenase large terminal subunit
MKVILPGAPWLIAHRSMLGINQPYKVTLNGQDYVLWQSNRGEVFALDNVCPHMQAPLSNGWICQERNTITCPFHALEFDGEGRLHREGKRDSQPIAQPLDLTVIGDCGRKDHPIGFFKYLVN